MKIYFKCKQSSSECGANIKISNDSFMFYNVLGVEIFFFFEVTAPRNDSTVAWMLCHDHDDEKIPLHVCSTVWMDISPSQVYAAVFHFRHDHVHSYIDAGGKESLFV